MNKMHIHALYPKITFPSQGFAALYLVLMVLVVILSIAMSLTLLNFSEQRIILNITESAQAYFAAESGVEDALLRLKKGWSTTVPTLQVGNATINVTISPIFAGARTVTSNGNSAGRIRKAEAVYQLEGDTPGFFYGAQVGDGGLRMENSSKVVGNVFSNGNAQLTGTAKITNTIQIAGGGNKISGGYVDGDAYVDICENNTQIAGTLHANTPGNCDYGSLTTSGLPIDPIPLPIPNSQIDEWKAEAAAGGTMGSFDRTNGIHTLGPVKIAGDLTIQNTAQLVVAGTIWVTGNIDIKNSGQVRLHSSYGSTSGIIVAGDGPTGGLITLQNSSVSSGSGQAGSYLMYISTSSADPAIVIENFAKVDILYSNTGWVAIENDTDMRSVNAYGIHVQNNAELTYEIGLENAFFTSGPSAGWTVTSWKEIP